MDLLTLVVLGIALVNVAVFAVGCALAIVRTRAERRRSDGRHRAPGAGPIAGAPPERSRITR
ncbi:MAG: hypothetical protein ACLGIJ_09090 [Candidatus Limnocylindria bacterium]